MNPKHLERLERWRRQAEAQGRQVLSAECVDIFFAFRRHQQSILFGIPIHPEQAPEFFCVYPAQTWIRGEISKWIWEITSDGKTRLWIPTELGWRSVIIGAGIKRILPLDGKITGSVGLETYRRPDCWWMSFFPN